jgi:integrase
MASNEGTADMASKRRKKKKRLYVKAGRWYADFRDYRDVGGKCEALIPPGSSTATTDEVIASKLVSNRLEELEKARRNKVLLGIERDVGLEEFAAHHLMERSRSGRVTDGWLQMMEHHLREAVSYFGSERQLAAIGTADVQKYVTHLRQHDNGRGGTLSEASTRKYINSLSNLYRRAQSEGVVPPGYNPVSSLMDKPVPRRAEARWLEVHEAAILLEAARLYKPGRPDVATRGLYAITATFLLTGGRQSEVLGLEVKDISFERKTVTFRPNEWRRLKTATSARTVPLWPQLEEVLGEYLSDAPKRRGLLFNSNRMEREGMVTDVRKALDNVAELTGWTPGDIRTKMLRHTYCAARLQTLDRGAPVSPWTVAKEMGHGGRALVDRVYGHLGEIRHRSDVVEYRVSQHMKVEGYKDRVKVIRERGGLKLLA